jgi:hypothetical protein
MRTHHFRPAAQFIVGPERRTVRGLRIVMAARNKNLRHMLYNDRNEDGTLRTVYERPQARRLGSRERGKRMKWNRAKG